MIINPSPDELKEFQIAHYSEMIEHPRSFEHKIFLRKEIFKLKNNCYANIIHGSGLHRRGVINLRDWADSTLLRVL